MEGTQKRVKCLLDGLGRYNICCSATGAKQFAFFVDEFFFLFERGIFRLCETRTSDTKQNEHLPNSKKCDMRKQKKRKESEWASELKTFFHIIINDVNWAPEPNSGVYRNVSVAWQSKFRLNYKINMNHIFTHSASVSFCSAFSRTHAHRSHSLNAFQIYIFLILSHFFRLLFCMLSVFYIISARRTHRKIWKFVFVVTICVLHADFGWKLAMSWEARTHTAIWMILCWPLFVKNYPCLLFLCSVY